MKIIRAIQLVFLLLSVLAMVAIGVGCGNSAITEPTDEPKPVNPVRSGDIHIQEDNSDGIDSPETQ